MPSTIVVGGGFGGLLIARGLRAAGHEVTLVEATDRLGGQIRTVDFCGLPVDVGAEAMFLGAPALRSVVAELGLLDAVVGPRDGTSWLMRGRSLKLLPAGVGPTGPTQIKPVLASGLLGPFALARAGLEPLRSRPITEDISVGDFVTRRFGRAVAETFVDPLLGNLHAGDIFRLSLHATAPQLRPTAESGRSILKGATARRPYDPDGPPLFATFPEGLGRLVDAIAADLAARGVGLHTNTEVTALERADDRWRVRATSGHQRADHVVLAVEGPNLTALLAPHVPQAADALAATPTASVASVLLAYPAESVPATIRDANGLLLDSRSGRMIKASTFLGRKWAHLASDAVMVVRASIGRARSDVLDLYEDDRLAGSAHRELADILDIRSRPVAQRVTRFPHAYPQLEVGHLARIAGARELLDGTGLHVAASAVDGLGLPAVVRSADAVVASITT